MLTTPPAARQATRSAAIGTTRRRFRASERDQPDLSLISALAWYGRSRDDLHDRCRHGRLGNGEESRRHGSTDGAALRREGGTDERLRWPAGGGIYRRAGIILESRSPASGN